MSYNDAGMDGGAGGSDQQSPPVLRMNSQRTRSGLPPAFEQQLTPKEIEVLSNMRQKVVLTRAAGSVAGGIATALFIRQRKQNLFQLPSVAKIIFGGFVGGLLTMPIALMASSKDIQQVEDPKHLVQVLTQSQRALGGGRMPPPQQGNPPIPGQIPAQQQQQQPQSMPSSSRGRFGREQGRTNQYGDDIGQAEMSYSNDFAGAPSVDQYTQPVANNSAQGMPRNDNSSDNDPNQQSRWAQLRSQRGVRESSWEKIRQENARSVYNQQMQRGQGQSQPDTSSSSSGYYDNRERNSGLADPDFGKGIAPTRLQAQKEYEKSFERERRGIDG